MKCENLKKGEKNILSIHNPTGCMMYGCMKSFENTTICFSMVDLVWKVLIPTQNLSFFHNYIIINWIDL